MLAQCTSSLLMIRPNFFRANEQTAGTNIYQQQSDTIQQKEIEKQAISEFDHALNRLRQNGIYVICLDNKNSSAPDAVFPNNWISFHHDGKVVLYPMYAANRRIERNIDFIKEHDKYISLNEIIDLTHYENKGEFLEGTGSVVFDHQHQIAYAALSPRTSITVLKDLCNRIGYKHFVFSAVDRGTPVYHTNVIMHIGNGYAVVCLEAVPDAKERNDLRRMLAFTGHELVPVTLAQMRMFAGNMLQVVNEKGKYFTLISSGAIRTLHLPQISIICEKSELLSFDISTIEKTGGGSIRCMVSELFCPVKIESF